MPAGMSDARLDEVRQCPSWCVEYYDHIDNVPDLCLVRAGAGFRRPGGGRRSRGGRSPKGARSPMPVAARRCRRWRYRVRSANGYSPMGHAEIRGAAFAGLVEVPGQFDRPGDQDRVGGRSGLDRRVKPTGAGMVLPRHGARNGSPAEPVPRREQRQCGDKSGKKSNSHNRFRDAPSSLPARASDEKGHAERPTRRTNRRHSAGWNCQRCCGATGFMSGRA
ncbi:MAG: hypothetical protein JWN03_2244 [Nocardia sp.]|nr:hypothetical protein [Nocardia sp.]